MEFYFFFFLLKLKRKMYFSRGCINYPYRYWKPYRESYQNTAHAYQIDKGESVSGCHKLSEMHMKRHLRHH